MKKRLIAGLVLGALITQVSFASTNNQSLGRHSLNLAIQLKYIAQENHQDLCAGDVLVASAYVQSAGEALSYDKVQSARVSLVYAQNELKEISNNRRGYCMNLAPKIKPYLAQLIIIQGELDAQNVKKA